MATKQSRPTAVADDISEELRLRMYRMQVELRESEQRAYDLFLQNLVKGTSHLSLGQEAVATGFAAAMEPGDLTFCTYRGHAHTLARGVPMDRVLGELMGRDNGLLRGKGGSMHLTSVEHGVMGSYAIVGAHIPIACGAAWRAQYKGEKDISVCFFGDGTTNIGAFHEGLNFAAIWKLPVVFVCENNLYMEYTPIGEVTAGEGSGGRTCVGIWTGIDRDRWPGCGCCLSHGERGLRSRAVGRRTEFDRMPDVSLQRSFARRSGEVSSGRRTRFLEGQARSDSHISRAAVELGHHGRDAG